METGELFVVQASQYLKEREYCLILSKFLIPQVEQPILLNQKSNYEYKIQASI